MPTPEQLLSRKSLASRWQVSCETVKRRTREGLLHPVYFNPRLIRYLLSEVLALEADGRSGRLIKNGLSTAEAERHARLIRNRGARKPGVTPPIGFHPEKGNE
jgi:hypothetical protein